MKYFVTGATGQVGHSLAKLLAEKTESPQDVVCLVRSPEKAIQLQELNVTMIRGDLDENSMIHKILGEHKIDIVFHVAAISDPSQDEDSDFFNKCRGL